MEIIQKEPIEYLKEMLAKNLSLITVGGLTLQELGYEFIVAEYGQQTGDYLDVLTVDEQATYDQPMYSQVNNREILSYRVATLTMVSKSGDRLNWNQGMTKKILTTLIVMIDDTSNLKHNIQHVAKTSTPRIVGDDLNGNQVYQARIKYIYKGEI